MSRTSTPYSFHKINIDERIVGMRLSSDYTEVVLQVIEKAALPHLIEVYLFGSRVDDTKLGGDIDLLILCPTVESKIQLLNQKYGILGNLYLVIGEQKIDLIFATIDDFKTDPFLQAIRSHAKCLSHS